MSRAVLWAIAVGILAWLLLYFWRGFFLHHATLMGLAIAALVYTGFRTVHNLRTLHRK